MKEIFLKDIYLCLYQKLQIVASKYNLDFDELHKTYLQDYYLLYMEYDYVARNQS